MVDIAIQKDKRGIFLDEVGVRGIKLPISVRDRTEKRKYQYTIGTFNAFVSLADNKKGTHMSRIVEILYNHREEISQEGLFRLTKELKEKLNTKTSKVEVAFPYFMDQWSPVSGMHNLMTYDARFVAEMNTTFKFILGVNVNVMSVCPCGRELCRDTGASHVQRGIVSISAEVMPEKWVWLEDLIESAELAGSSPVYDRLKRPDEKQVILNGFKNPKFVEDIVRDCILSLSLIDGIKNCTVSCENQESIHTHEAFARSYCKWK